MVGSANAMGNFQCQGVRLIGTVVVQGATVLAVDAVGGGAVFLSPIISVFSLLSCPIQTEILSQRAV